MSTHLYLYKKEDCQDAKFRVSVHKNIMLQKVNSNTSYARCMRLSGNDGSTSMDEPDHTDVSR